jgi:hypothetical protein
MTLFVQDTFTGTGSLVTHVGETGATWSYFDRHFNFDMRNEAQLDGNGNIRHLSTFSQDWAFDMKASGVPPSPDYFVEVDYSTSGTLSSDDAVALYLRLQGTSSNDYLTVELAPGINNVYWEDHQRAPFGNDTLTGTFTGSHTLRAEVEGTALRVKIDGVLLATHTIITAAAGKVGFGIAKAGSGTVPSLIVVSAFRAGDFAAPPPPPPDYYDFWERVTGASQL